MRSVRSSWMLVIVCLAVTTAAAAQTQPNFAGTWVEDESARKTTIPTPPPGAQTSKPLPPADLVVKQDGKDLVTERTFMSHVIRYVYHLDGSESVNKNGANTLTTRSTWDGGKLITKGTSFSVTSAGEFLWEVKETRWLDKSGAMVVETRTTDEAGKENVVTLTYRRRSGRS